MGVKPAPDVPARKSPVPERFIPNGQEDTDSQNPLENTLPLVQGSVAQRFAKPGSIRWVVELNDPITFIRWTPLAGLVVSSGAQVHNITSRGEDRWHLIQGERHRLFAIDETEFVWSPAFGKIEQLLRRGRRGWSRKWTGDISVDSKGGVYLIDASTVSSIGADGLDRWRATPEGVRKLEGPFLCNREQEHSLLFNGIRGLSTVAVRITEHGAVVKETPLGRGAVLIGAGPKCEPLIWRAGSLVLLSEQGDTIWKANLPATPFVNRLAQGGFISIAPRADKPAQLDIITDDGRSLRHEELPMTGRITAAKVVPNSDIIDVKFIGLCQDVTSPCSKPEENRGPFNALITNNQGIYRSMIRHIQGHLNVAEHPDGIAIASSATETNTDLTLRNHQGNIIWQTTLEGRLSAGPYVGPDGEIYLATCKGWECEKPRLLISLTGQHPPEKEDDK